MTPVLAGLAAAAACLGLGSGTTFAASTSPRVALAVVARADLGPATAFGLETFVDTEAPNGTFYFASGDMVNAVTGAGSPATVLRASGKVLALAATSGSLYVQSGLDVAQYTVPGAQLRRSWVLTPDQSTPPRTPTESGLLAAGGVVWSWDDWETDVSGLEYATVDELFASGVRMIGHNAYPDDMAADDSGLYYEADGYLAHVTPGGSLSKRSFAGGGSPMALSSGSVVLSTVDESTGTPYLERFSEATLGKQGSVPEPAEVGPVAETSVGLLATACKQNSSQCAVWLVDPLLTGATANLAVAGLVELVEGPAPAALALADGHGYLVRLGTTVPAASAAPVLGSRTFIFHGIGWGSVKPAYLSNNGDPGGNLQQVTWGQWGGADAYGEAYGFVERPTYGYYRVRVELRASDLGYCLPDGPLAYRDLAVREPSHPGGALGAWTPWWKGGICTSAT